MYRQQQQANRSPRGGHGEKKKKKKEETVEVQIFGWQHTDQEMLAMKRGQRRLLSRITRVRV